MERRDVEHGPRVVPEDDLWVLEAETRKVLGRLGDVGPRGARVRGCRYLPQDLRMRVAIETPPEGHHRCPIEAEARVVWCRIDPSHGGHEVGLELLELDRASALALAELFYRRFAA